MIFRFGLSRAARSASSARAARARASRRFRSCGCLTSTAKIESGRIAFLGRDLVGLPERQMQSIRGRDISMIFQEPMTSLNPVFTVGAQIMEAIILHQHTSKAEAREKTIDLLREVGIPKPEQRIDSYPHQMSGGQKQRVMIAMALSCNPQLLIADEPTTALDVTIQAQILEILRRLRDDRGMSIIFITHDLGVIAEIADDVLVMYRGEGGRVRPGARHLRPAEAPVHEGPARLPAAARNEVPPPADGRRLHGDAKRVGRRGPRRREEDGRGAAQATAKQGRGPAAASEVASSRRSAIRGKKGSTVPTRKPSPKAPRRSCPWRICKSISRSAAASWPAWSTT